MVVIMNVVKIQDGVVLNVQVLDDGTDLATLDPAYEWVSVTLLEEQPSPGDPAPAEDEGEQ